MLQTINQRDFIKQPLACLPTPIEPMNNLSKILGGPQLYIKRDDLTGLAFGGNKTRKLEYLLADAIDQGADTIITAGAIQSNHCRQTAAGAAKLGLECHLVLGGDMPTNPNGNLLLNQLLNATLHFNDNKDKSGDKRKGEDIPALVQTLKAQGKKPYVIPYGGSNEIGALGFVEAMIELKNQQVAKQPFSHIVFASSSAGTHAGMIVGKVLTEQNCQLVGIRIDKQDNGPLPFDQQIQALANTTAALIGLKPPISAAQVRLNQQYNDLPYGELGELERQAINLCAQHEGILLDPVYTGRAMGALIDMIKQHKFSPNDNILFWHTGGAPALFAYSEQLTNRE